MRRVLPLIFVVLLLWEWDTEASVAQAPSKMTIGYASMSTATVILWVAQDEGFFSKNNIEAELVFMPGSPTLIAALNSGSVPVGYTGGTATLGAVAGGVDLKILAASHGRVLHDLVVRSDIKHPQDLRGKRVGVTSIGGTGWMAAMLGLEQLGLSPERDNIIVSGYGDQRVAAQALESGTIDGATLTGIFSLRLKRLGFRFLGELDRIPLLGSGIVVKGTTLQNHGDLIRNVVRAIVAAHAFVFNPANKPAVLKTLMKRLRITDLVLAEDGLQDLLRRMDRKPYPSIEALRNIQRFIQLRNPKVGRVKLEELIDDTILRDLDNRGFLDGLYSRAGEGR